MSTSTDPQGTPAAADATPDQTKGQPGGAPVTTDLVWRAIEKASFAIVGHVTPGGEPRSSGIVYVTIDRRMYVVVGKESWKARHIAASGRVSVTVPVRRGGLLTLLFPIPPATVSFHGSTTVYAGDSPESEPVVHKLGRLLPPTSRAECSIIEIRPEGNFLTYGIGIPLMQMRDTVRSRGRVPVA